MKTNTTAPNDKGFRFPSEIISHAVWLYFRFSLSFKEYRAILQHRFQMWNEVTGVKQVA